MTEKATVRKLLKGGLNAENLCWKIQKMLELYVN